MLLLLYCGKGRNAVFTSGKRKCICLQTDFMENVVKFHSRSTVHLLLIVFEMRCFALLK